ncbi:hypothetical protein O3P69_006237 [Scylla paramamosain]|uniref:Uncharacterized protein n=1 Tax=Scylla paramamosain TaxID=85552 RepID=A0AAW0U7F5_SCYPA
MTAYLKATTAMTVHLKAKGCIFLACFILFFLLWLVLQTTNTTKASLNSESPAPRSLLKVVEPATRYHRQARQWNNGVNQHEDQHDGKSSFAKEERIRSPRSCPTDDVFICPNGEEICVAQVCDGNSDCNDSEDEKSCECATNRTCDDFTCLDETNICDGIEDCFDKKDEANCSTTTITISTHSSIPTTTRLNCRLDNPPKLCKDNVTFACYCDMVPECPENEDEKNCGQATTSSNPTSALTTTSFTLPTLISTTPHHTSSIPTTTPSGSATTSSNPTSALTTTSFTLATLISTTPHHTSSIPTTTPSGSATTSSNPTSALTTTSFTLPTLISTTPHHTSSIPTTTPSGSACRPDQVTCGDGSCLEGSARCDGSSQCSDDSDELNCPTTCRPDQVTCGDGSCLEGSARCDGSPQCSDNSDELNCPTMCRPGEWQCGDLYCVPEDQRCDGTYQCPDYSDEMDCPACNEEEWMCLDRTCIPLRQRCDYVYDCLDCSDEENCPGYWRCRDGFFISDRKRCDGHYDCYDGSDETYCWYHG